MTINEFPEGKRTNLLLFVVVIILLGLYYSNPPINSFKTYIKQHARDYNGPVGSIITHFNVWYAKKTSAMSHFDFLLFSIVKAPSYLLEVFDVKKMNNCVFVGVLFNWFPICYSTNLGEKIRFSQCSYKGIPFGLNRCVCLPSWYGEDCSK